ncbi:MAG: transposase [Anaerolineae bacterium]
MAEWALNTAQWLRPWALPPPKGRGRPRVYSDVSVFLADAAYFNYTFLGFVRDVLGASPVVDYNLRRKGKRFSATLFFLQQWKTAMGPRSNIERCFAFLKRYYGLANFQVKGLEAVTRYAFQVHIAMLMVALIATRCGRSELATSRAKVLAFVN